MSVAEKARPRVEARHPPMPATSATGTVTSPSRTVVVLSSSVAGLAIVIAAVGLLWQNDGAAFSIPTYRGQIADIYGTGIYADDTLFVAGNNKASDLVTLFLGIPLLASALVLYRAGSFRGRLLLLGTLGYFVYIGASYSLGAVAYNELFLLYVAMFSAALFGLIATFFTFDRVTVDRHFATHPPRRWIGIFMVISAVVTLIVWVMEPVGSLVEGRLPKRLDVYSTLFTHAFDMAIIVPAAMIAGLLILRRSPQGYVVAFSLLILEAMLAPLIATATLVQIRLGIDFTTGEVVGPIVGFTTIAVAALWAICTILREAAPSRSL